MAVGYFCVHTPNDPNDFYVCVQGAIVTRTPRQLLTVDAYEAATPTEKLAYDASLAGVNAVYSLVDHTAPDDEDDE